MKSICVVLGAVVVIAGLLLTQAYSQQGAVAEVHVSFDPAANPPIHLDVDPVVIEAGGRVRWRSTGNRGDQIEIEFDAQGSRRGPFPASGNSENPSRGRYNKNVGSPILTRDASDTGEWKYTVSWTTADGTRYELDPRIIVR